MYIDDTGRLQHMLEWTRKAAEIVRSSDLDTLRVDWTTALALVKCLEVIGEAAFKITRDYKDAHPEIAWRDLADMRNRLVHEYFAFDLDRAWAVATTDIPALTTELEKLIPPQPL